jgi:hypothetical protein
MSGRLRVLSAGCLALLLSWALWRGVSAPGACVRGQAATSDATCDDIDDDCDGRRDDDYESVATRCGIGACASRGTTHCEGGKVVDDCTSGMPTADTTCNARDEDCDGSADESFPSALRSGTCGLGACVSPFATRCVQGEVSETCTPGIAAQGDARPDGIDEDCDGSTDEDVWARAPQTDMQRPGASAPIGRGRAGEHHRIQAHGAQ